MGLNRFVASNRILEIKSKTLEDAFRELLENCLKQSPDLFDKDLVQEQLLTRERNMTTMLSNGIALPHTRVSMKRPYIFAIGRCPNGLDFEKMPEYRNLRVIFLVLASQDEPTYLNVLGSIARTFQNKNLVQRILEARDLKTFRSEALGAFKGIQRSDYAQDSKFNHFLFKQTERIAKGMQCSAVMIFGDTFSSNIKLKSGFSASKTVLVTQSPFAYTKQEHFIDAVINIRSFSQNRLSQLQSAIFVGLTRGIFKYSDRICCVGGIPHSNQLDAFLIFDIEREFQSVFTTQLDLLPACVKPEVLEQIITIATELSIEGREGKPIGSIFVVGNYEEIKPFIKPLVLNPFFGYKEEERHILNPFMDETIKEFSSIDGAFVIQGNGVVETAGSLIHTPNYIHKLPGGLGSRHAAAAAISLATDCIAITISSSNGQVTLFRRGQMLPLVEHSYGSFA